jgi:pyruvate ferredoxin oxidoreductase alpha subunit
MFVHDGFIISHAVHKFWAIPDEDVLKLVPKNKRHFVDVDNPASWGSIVTPEYFMEQRYATVKDKDKTLDDMDDAFAEFGKMTGRHYKQIETRNLDGNNVAFLTMGSMCGNIASYQVKNSDIGLIKLRVWRPFPLEKLRKIVESNNIEKIAVLEKNDAPGALLPQVSQSVYSALSDMGVTIRSYIIGLGGRDVTKDELNYIKKDISKAEGNKPPLYQYVGLREKQNKIIGVDEELDFSSHI